jgi:hypothetical protein
MLNDRFPGRTTLPPFDPAFAASSLFCEKARFSGGTDFPPFVAISLRFSGVMAANPRLAGSTTTQFDVSEVIAFVLLIDENIQKPKHRTGILFG